MSAMSRADPRTPLKRIREQAIRVAAWSDIRELMDAIPDILLVVNTTRQIVFANGTTKDFFHAKKDSDLWGKRPGEAAGCTHARETAGGCGTSEACKVCGAFQAIIRGLQGENRVEDCRMLLHDGTALDLRVWARPFELHGERFVFLTIRDVSNEKRRAILEKLFFHDILNTAGGLQSISEILEGSTTEELREFREIIASLSEQLVDEVQAQRDLFAAEQGELHAQMRRINSRDVISRTVSLYLKNQVCDGKSIQAPEIWEEIAIVSDMTLLTRVLGNLVKNALEATPPSGTVTIGCRRLPDSRVEFFVHNESSIPHEVQLQIFKRSFSTKGNGRGLGTYSVKLLTERFLDGTVDFSSTSREGTTFFVRLPVEKKPDAPLTRFWPPIVASD